MSPAIFLGVVVAGGLGAAARFVVDGVVSSRAATTFPLGTTLINLSGSLVLGFVTGLVASAAAPREALLVLGTGFLGGYTTFSTASLETVRLARQRRLAAAALHGIGGLVGGVACAALGYALGVAL